MKNRKLLYTVLIILSGLLLSFFDLPAETQKEWLPITPQAVLNSRINLGLDLQGGAQLDYKIDMRKVPENEKKVIVDGILNVINRRVNSLGVAEPNIYTSDIGDEKHLIVELAGIKDLEKAKQIVGKTIQLEFKEQSGAQQDDPARVEEVKGKAQTLLDKALAGSDLSVLGREEQQASPEKVGFYEETEFKYKDEVDSNLAVELFNLEQEQTLDHLIDNSNNMTIDSSGQIVPGPKGFHILQTTEKQDTKRTIDTPRSVKVSHILIAHKDAQKAGSGITRSKDEAKQIAQEVIDKLNAGGNFAALAKEYSDDAGSAEKEGELDKPVSKDEGTYVKEFETAAVSFQKVGEISSAPVESPFGYHILKSDEINEAKSETTVQPQIKYIDVYYSAAPDPWQETGLNGQNFVRADVEFTPTLQPYVSIVFDDEGAKKFEDLTRKNINRPIAIFVGGQLISAPNVNEVIAGGRAQITGRFTVDEANNLARDLNTGAIPAPITLAGQYSIGATLGHDALQKSLYAGVLGFLILALFMILYYRLPGILATIALAIYSASLLFLVKVAMDITWALGISVVLFVYLLLRILKNRESGAEKTITAILACFILFFATFILNSPIVLTLAGIAGIILSIGMAVDANILIFERIKEELRDGRQLNAAIEVGFDRAWSSIRDSNFSSLITCAILFYFGSSIIQGFAFNLAAGILVSMFSAITITKTFLEFTANTGLGKKLWVFNAPKKKTVLNLPIIKNRKKYYAISAFFLILSIIGLPLFGLKLGLDFTGGTLMELKFEQQVTPDQLKTALAESGETVKNNLPELTDDTATPDTALPATTDNSTSVELQFTASDKDVDFSKAQIVPSENGYIVKTPHISSALHDKLITELKTKLGAFEES
ncbi:peptidylprolyl isomerase, partial [Patescibacteria group bacterium]|nr:peptidylprolyl isomerase [Patescibacteria group bacterium]MBU1703547.1 peptidylprolyl isomerase [Patescibacteria group bacterium]